jgi:hypothetical protein
LFAQREVRFHGRVCSSNAEDLQSEKSLHALCVVLFYYEHNIPVVFHILSCESRISSLNDLNHSVLKYGSNSDTDDFLRAVEYEEHDRLNIDWFECADYEKCLERLFTESDTTFVANIFIAQYFASSIGKTADKNLLCSLDKYIFSSNSVILFRKGHPVIDSFNIVIRRCIEAGHGDKYWLDLYFNLTLQNMRKLEVSDCQACNDTYFVFSLTHLRVAFVVLGFGYDLSVAVFVAELICKWLSKRRTVTASMHETPPFPFLP